MLEAGGGGVGADAAEVFVEPAGHLGKPFCLDVRGERRRIREFPTLADGPGAEGEHVPEARIGLAVHYGERVVHTIVGAQHVEHGPRRAGPGGKMFVPPLLHVPHNSVGQRLVVGLLGDAAMDRERVDALHTRRVRTEGPARLVEIFFPDGGADRGLDFPEPLGVAGFAQNVGDGSGVSDEEVGDRGGVEFVRGGVGKLAQGAPEAARAAPELRHVVAGGDRHVVGKLAGAQEAGQVGVFKPAAHIGADEREVPFEFATVAIVEIMHPGMLRVMLLLGKRVAHSDVCIRRNRLQISHRNRNRREEGPRGFQHGGGHGGIIHPMSKDREVHGGDVGIVSLFRAGIVVLSSLHEHFQRPERGLLDVVEERVRGGERTGCREVGMQDDAGDGLQRRRAGIPG